MQLHHINIKGPKAMLAEEKSFFCNVLGLKEGPRPKLVTSGYWLYAGNHALIHLNESDEHYSNDKQGYFDHAAFQTKGLPLFIKKLDELSLDRKVIFREESDTTQVFIKAPSGIKIEVNFKHERP